MKKQYSINIQQLGSFKCQYELGQ